MKRPVLLCIFMLACLGTYAQREAAVLETNRQIDAAVVAKDLGALENLYAPDFVFTHGTGTVDNKESWLRSVSRPEQKFVSRIHDSTSVELHQDIALVTGVLTVTRLDGQKEARYRIWYLRIFRNRDDKWRLISHRTTRELHL